MLIPTFREIVLPLIFITFALGFELSLFLLHQYYKRKGEQLSFNKILLALGLFYFCASIGYVFRMFNIITILRNTFFQEFYRIIGILFFFLGVLSFLIVIQSKSFQGFINTSQIKIVIALCVYGMISVIFFQLASLGYAIAVIIGFLGELVF